MAKTGTFGQSLKRITYYGVALNPAGKYAQVLVIRDGGRQVSQEFTGVTFKTQREAMASTARANEERAADRVTGVR